MEKVFEKFGIYDFLGIWWPGAIAVTYFMFTAEESVVEFIGDLNNLPFIISEKYFLIIIYTAVAYTIGVIIHETGKMIFDMLPLFDFDKITYFEGISKKKSLLPLSKIRYDYNRAIDSCGKGELASGLVSEDINFESAILKLKYDNSFGRIERYHSAYAFSRGLAVLFGVHMIYSGASFFINGENERVVLFLIDIVLTLIFFFRSYRYYLSWIKNAYVRCFQLYPKARKFSVKNRRRRV